MADPGPVIVVSGPTGVGKTTVSGLVAATFEPSVHLRTDGFLAAIVRGRVYPGRPEATRQNEAVGAALAVSAMAYAAHGYTTVVDGHLFPDGVRGLATASAAQGLPCHYAVLAADVDTCWQRASSRGEGRWPLEPGPVTMLHARFAGLDLPERRVIDASGSAEAVADAVLAAFRAGRLAV